MENEHRYPILWERRGGGVIKREFAPQVGLLENISFSYKPLFDSLPQQVA